MVLKDVKAAFDSVRRDFIPRVPETRGMLEKMTRIIKRVHNDSNSSEKIDNFSTFSGCHGSPAVWNSAPVSV